MFKDCSPIDNAVQEARSCDILVADCDVISKVLENPGKLKWIQSTWAGKMWKV